MGIDPPTDDAAVRAAADIEASVAAGDWAEAYAGANRAISRGLRHPVFFRLRARRMDETGHLKFALEDYQRAAALAPKDPEILEAIGNCATKLEDFRVAADAFDQAIASSPANARLHYRRGLAQAQLGEHDAAQAAFEEAIRLDPDFADALASLSAIFARRGRHEEGRALAERALVANPNQATAVVSLAQSDLGQRRFQNAEQRLRELIAKGNVPRQNRPQMFSFLGDALDGQERYAEAFAEYCHANEELQQIYAAKFGGNLGLEAARNLIGFFENEPAKRWLPPAEQAAIGDAFQGHVFLMGFMRSGTTLLEQVLASNPDIVALEEKGLLNEPGETYLTSIEGLQELGELSGEELVAVRRNYWKRVRDYVPQSTARIFVDKQPLNTSRLPLIAKAFPDARIIFALRDPRDVVFSCFRRHMRVTGSQYEFLFLERCARFYSNVMRLAEICRSKMQLTLHVHRYEDMIADFEGRVRAVCDFIGVPWTDAMGRFNEQKIVAHLNSPSALQVRRPLYSEGAGHWRHYHDQLKPILPILEPWVEKFGYPRD